MKIVIAKDQPMEFQPRIKPLWTCWVKRHDFVVKCWPQSFVLNERDTNPVLTSSLGGMIGYADNFFCTKYYFKKTFLIYNSNFLPISGGLEYFWVHLFTTINKMSICAGCGLRTLERFWKSCLFILRRTKLSCFWLSNTSDKKLEMKVNSFMSVQLCAIFTFISCRFSPWIVVGAIETKDCREMQTNVYEKTSPRTTWIKSNVY